MSQGPLITVGEFLRRVAMCQKNTQNPPPLNEMEKRYVDAGEIGRAFWAYRRRNWVFGGAACSAISTYIEEVADASKKS